VRLSFMTARWWILAAALAAVVLFLRWRASDSARRYRLASAYHAAQVREYTRQAMRFSGRPLHAETLRRRAEFHARMMEKWRTAVEYPLLPVSPDPPPPVVPPPATADSRVTRSFPAGGIGTVVLRAELAEKAAVKVNPGAEAVTVSGIPEGDAVGYHPPQPGWKQTPPEEWGLDFAARLYGGTLVVSTVNEIEFIHHYYHLCDIEIGVPETVKVIRQKRKLSGSRQSDLTPADLPGQPAGAMPTGVEPSSQPSGSPGASSGLL
jgi:hypothetical protein